MKRTLAGLILVAAMLAAIAWTADGKPPRGRFGFLAGMPTTAPPPTSPTTR